VEARQLGGDVLGDAVAEILRPGSPLMLVKGRTVVESLSILASSRGGKNGGEEAPNTLDGHSKAFNVDSRIPSSRV